MPVVEVEIILKPEETISPEVASKLADELGRILGSSRNGTWLKLRGLPEVYYAENGGKEPDIYPVFVSVLKASLPGLEEMQGEVAAIVQAVAQICKRPPSLIHVIYEPEGKGRVAFGGRIVN